MNFVKPPSDEKVGAKKVSTVDGLFYVTVSGGKPISYWFLFCFLSPPPPPLLEPSAGLSFREGQKTGGGGGGIQGGGGHIV